MQACLKIPILLTAALTASGCVGNGEQVPLLMENGKSILPEGHEIICNEYTGAMGSILYSAVPRYAKPDEGDPLEVVYDIYAYHGPGAVPVLVRAGAVLGSSYMIADAIKNREGDTNISSSGSSSDASSRASSAASAVNVNQTGGMPMPPD